MGGYKNHSKYDNSLQARTLVLQQTVASWRLAMYFRKAVYFLELSYHRYGFSNLTNAIESLSLVRFF